MTPSHGRTFCACTKPETKRNASRCFFFVVMNWNRMIMITMMDCAIAYLESSLFLGWKCATSPRPEVKWQWKPPSITWCISVLPRTKLFSLFLNIEKVLQTTATTNGSETHSCQPKSQAAKSKWAKIETGLSLGNRWEMFYFMPGLGRGRARRRRHQLRTSFVRLGELVASIRRQFMSFCFTDVHPISCSSFFHSSPFAS